MVGKGFKDARGVKRNAMSIDQTDRIMRRFNVPKRELTKAARGLTPMFLRRLPWILGIFAIIFVVIVMITRSLQLPIGVGGDFREPMAEGAGVTLLLLLCILLWQESDTLSRRALVLPEFGICACCGYELKGLAPEDDGCTVCPECGCAWRRDRRS